MTIPIDKRYHLLAGLLTLCCLLLLQRVAALYGIGPALALASTIMGVAIEAYQWARKEGTVDPYDALATAAPGWVAWAAVAWWPQ